MSNYFKCILLATAMLLTSSCSVFMHREVSYSGKKNATKPYVEMAVLYTNIISCVKSFNTCSVVVSVEPTIHNPTTGKLNGVLECSFELDNYQPPVIKSKVVLNPHKSRIVDVTSTVEVPADRRSSVTASCVFRYKNVVL